MINRRNSHQLLAGVLTQSLLPALWGWPDNQTAPSSSCAPLTVLALMHPVALRVGILAPAPSSLEPWLVGQPPPLLPPRQLTAASATRMAFGMLQVQRHHKSFFLAEKWMVNGMYIYNTGTLSPCQGLLPHHQASKTHGHISLSPLSQNTNITPLPPDLYFNGIALKQKPQEGIQQQYLPLSLTQPFLPRGAHPLAPKVAATSEPPSVLSSHRIWLRMKWEPPPEDIS